MKVCRTLDYYVGLFRQAREAAWPLLHCIILLSAILFAPNAPRALAAEESRAFPVHSFTFTGNTVFTHDELIGLLKDRVGRQLSLAELEATAGQITRLYQEQGHILAFAYIPLQEIVDGVVEIAVVEGRYGQVIIDKGSRLKESVVRNLLGPVRPGALIQSASLDQAVRLLNGTPGVSARASLEATAEPGVTDIVVRIEDESVVSGRISIDNAGSVSMGRNQAALAAFVDNPTGWGDRLSLQWLGAGSGMNYGRAAYETFFLGSRWRSTLSYASARYQLGAPFEALESSGTVSHYEVAVRYPISRSGRGRSDLALSYGLKDLSDSLLAEEARASISSFTATMNASRSTGGSLGRSFEGSLSLSGGRLNLLDTVSASHDAASAKAEDSFVTLRASVAARQPLSASTALYVTGRGQLASKNLHRSEKFSLAGSDGVRAYPPGAVSGDAGWLVRAEVRYNVASHGLILPSPVIGAFVDAGRVVINQSPWPGAEGPNDRSLVGGGVSLTFAPTNRVTFRLDYAFPLTGDGAAHLAGPQLWARLEARM